MGLSNELSCEAGSFSCCHLIPHGCFQSEVWGFISPCWSPGLRGLFRSPTVPPGSSMRECGAVASASCSLACPGPQSATSLGPPDAPLLWVLSPRLPASAPPTSLDECFFFISLVVRLPYSSIFCQFLLFLFLNCCCPSFGCVRRDSVSTYASILAGVYLFLNHVAKMGWSVAGTSRHREGSNINKFPLLEN